MRIESEPDILSSLGITPMHNRLVLTTKERELLRQARILLERADTLQREVDNDPEGDNDWHAAEVYLASALDSAAGNGTEAR